MLHQTEGANTYQSMLERDRTSSSVAATTKLTAYESLQVISLESYGTTSSHVLLLLLQVILNGSQSMHAVSEMGVQVQSADRSELLQIKTYDAALVSPGHPNPFPNGAFAPCMREGMHFNLVNNIWGTNYVMWVPYRDDDVNMAFRFGIHAEKTQQQQRQRQWRQHRDQQQHTVIVQK